MPKHNNKQRRNNWSSGFERNNWQNPNNSYQNDQSGMGQNYYNNTYFDPSFQYNATQSYSNDFSDPRYHNSMAQNYNNSYFNPNNSNGNFRPNFSRNFTQNGEQHQSYKNNVPRNTMINVRNNNFNNETNGSSSNNLNRSFQGNIQYSSNNTNDIGPNLIDDETNVTCNSTQQNIEKNPQQKPCNTESHYQHLNVCKLSKEVKLNAPVDGYAIQTQSFIEKGYIIKESLYKNPCLFQTHRGSNNDQTNSNETNDEWTDAYWKKHNASSAPDNSRTCQNIGTVSKKNQNRLEKSLNKMLAQPAEMSKGMSLLQKMGWTGGGLGRDGDGIVEPIAPKATYAVKTIGLGHLTEKVEKPKKSKPFSQMNKHQLKAPEFQNNFCLNLLLYILHFVKNDEQNKIVFEPRLSRMERKRIHEFVAKIRESTDLDEFDDIKHLTDKHYAFIQDIWVHNCYELWTESEGEGQDRCLCLYKEAPAHVFLVTPEDLTMEENDETETNDDSNQNNEQDTLHCSNVKNDSNEEAIENIKSENDKEMDGNEKSIKNDENDSVLGKIVKYFKEFLADAVFKEFRFLGPFNDDELMNINLFFDICMGLDDGDCDGEEKGELVKLFGDGSLEVLEDNNGKRFIHKK